MKRIPLTQGKVALIDDEDFGLVDQFKWSVPPSLLNPDDIYRPLEYVQFQCAEMAKQLNESGL